MYNARKTW